MNRLFRISCGLLLLATGSTLLAAKFDSVQPQPGQWQESHQAFGHVSARAESTIRLPFPVRITESHLTPGQAVAKGSILLSFEAPRLHQVLSAYRDARSATQVARKRVQVLRSGRKEHTATRQEYLTGEQDLIAAKARESERWNALKKVLAVVGSTLNKDTVTRLLKENKLEVAYQKMRGLHAPYRGIVAQRPPTTGTWINAGDVLITLEDSSQVYVSVGVPNQQINAWQAGRTRIRLGDHNLALQRLPGTPRLDPETGLRIVIFQADNTTGDLQDGQWVSVTHLSAPREVLWVPESAIVSRHGKSWCLLVKGDDAKPTPIRVVTGEPREGKQPVLSGLNAGQAVLIKDAYEWLYRDLKDLIRFVE